jgi:hypothetical protein
MALRTPLVIVNGQIQQLQAGDTLNVTAVGGGDVVSLTNDNAGSVTIGQPVYATAADHFDKARANASGTVQVIGLVQATSIGTGASGNVQVNGILTATTGQWDAAFGTTGGLTFGTRYWLSATTAGVGTSTAPTTVGQYDVELGIALSTTELSISITTPILL